MIYDRTFHAVLAAITCLLAPTFCLADEPTEPPIPPEVLVVCPQGLTAELAPWIEFRHADGYRVVVTSDTKDAATIRRTIRAAAKAASQRNSSLAAILLVGDVADDRQPATAAAHSLAVPTHLAEAKINVRWGSEPQIATDNWYADLDDDTWPDVPIGRFSVDTPAQLKQVVAKTLEYERQHDFGMWRRRLHFVAGVGGFGKLADSILENGTRYFLTSGIPASYRTTMTYANWRSPYCPDPSRFRETTIRRLNEGSLFWVYIGHGHRHHLDVMRTPTGRYPILSDRDMPHISAQSGAPIALFLSCYAGAFDAPQDCLAEQLLRRESGPVAVIAGSRVTMPYAMAVMGTGMLDHCFQTRCETVGQVLLGGKRSLRQAGPKNANRALLDSIAGAISPAPVDLKAERMEHLHLFNLLGDPLLRIRHPQQVDLQAPATALAGEEIEIAIRAPFTGRCRLELVVQRDRLAFTPLKRDRVAQDPQGRAAAQAVYERANDPRLASGDFTLATREFRTKLRVPEGASGPCHVTVFVEGENDFASAATNIRIRKPPRTAAPTVGTKN